MTRSARRTGLAGLTVLALAVSAVGPCHCLLRATACHTTSPQADAHACCGEPAGVQAVADECCGGAPELVLASTDVPEVAAPAVRADRVAVARPPVRVIEVGATLAPRPHPPDRTTVLLI